MNQDSARTPKKKGPSKERQHSAKRLRQEADTVVPPARSGVNYAPPLPPASPVPRLPQK